MSFQKLILTPDSTVQEVCLRVTSYKYMILHQIEEEGYKIFFLS